MSSPSSNALTLSTSSSMSNTVTLCPTLHSVRALAYPVRLPPTTTKCIFKRWSSDPLLLVFCAAVPFVAACGQFSPQFQQTIEQLQMPSKKVTPTISQVNEYVEELAWRGTDATYWMVAGDQVMQAPCLAASSLGRLPSSTSSINFNYLVP